MIFRYLAIIFVLYGSVAIAEFDDSYLWHELIRRPSGDTGSFTYDNDGVSSKYLHSDVHGIEGLSWNFLSIDFNRGLWGISAEFSTFGYKSYYLRNRYFTKFGFYPGRNIVLAPSMQICTEKFANIGHYTELSGGFHIGYMAEKYNLETGFAEIVLKKPYPAEAGEQRLKPFVSGSWVFNDGLTLTVGIRRFENRRTRWVFDQYIMVNKILGMNFGYMNRPSCIYGGIDLTIKGFSVIISYCSLGELADSIILGIAFGK